MNVSMENLGWTLVHSLWQWTLVALLAGALNECFRRRSASARYSILVVALVIGGTLTTLTWAVIAGRQSAAAERFAARSTLASRDRVGFGASARSSAILETDDSDGGDRDRDRRSREFSQERFSSRDDSAFDERSGAQAAQLVLGNSPSTAWAAWLPPYFPWLVGAWCVGVALSLVRPLLGWRTLRTWRRLGVSPVDDDLRRVLLDLSRRMQVTRSVELLQSTLASVPVVIGYVKPVILLPVSLAANLPLGQLEALLAHELAHVRRHDFVVNLLQAALETLFFYHPAVWWLSRRIRVEREHCCDDLVIERLSNRAEYGRALVALEELRAAAPRLALGASDGSLVSRIRRIVEGDAAAVPRGPALSAAFAALLLAGLSFQSLVAQAERPEDKSPAKSLRATLVANVDPPRPAKTTQWPQFGGSATHNHVASGNLPRRWDLKSGLNVRWQSPLGASTFSSPVIANGKIFVGTSNGNELVAQRPPDTDLALLLCLDEQTGARLWQYVSEKRSDSRESDWPDVGIGSTACVVDDRVYLMTNRCEIVCLDVEGFRDGENDGETKDEAGQGEGDADVVWRFDLFRSLGVRPLHQPISNVTVVEGLVLLHTSNAPDESFRAVAAPQAPQFVALRASTGELVWQDATGSDAIAAGGSTCGCSGPAPAVARIGGVEQAVFAGRDGWLYGFDFESLKRGSSKVLWKFDCNPKRSTYGGNGPVTRNTLVASPVIVGDRVYVATGRNPEEGEGPGDLWCVDATKRGDLSTEQVFHPKFREGREPIAHKSFQACDESVGDFTRPNPNSGALWHYVGADHDGDGQRSYVESFHRTLGTPAVQDGLLFIVDFGGVLHCVDAMTGRGQWTRDLVAQGFASCVIADGIVMALGDDDELKMFKVSRTCEPIRTGRTSLNHHLYATPALVNDTLFIAMPNRIVAVRDVSPEGKNEPESTDREVKE